MADYLAPQGRRLAYDQTDGAGPGIVFLGGYKSDRGGSKATYLEDWAKAQGRAYLRFDYSGHGDSSEAFEDGCIGDWYDDAVSIIESLTHGPQILVGSSMGGWISLLIARDRPDLVAGLITIAAAPDFATLKWESLTEAQQAEVEAQGFHQEPSEYGEDYIFTKRLFEDGKKREVFSQPLALGMPIRMVQGTEDNAVSEAIALRLLHHCEAPDISLELVRGKDHSFSDPDCLALIAAKITEVSQRL